MLLPLFQLFLPVGKLPSEFVKCARQPFNFGPFPIRANRITHVCDVVQELLLHAFELVLIDRVARDKKLSCEFLERIAQLHGAEGSGCRAEVNGRQIAIDGLHLVQNGNLVGQTDARQDKQYSKTGDGFC